MYIKVKKHSAQAKLVKQIKEAQNLDELKGAMLQMLKNPTTLNNSTQGAKRG